MRQYCTSSLVIELMRLSVLGQALCEIFHGAAEIASRSPHSRRTTTVTDGHSPRRGRQRAFATVLEDAESRYVRS